MGRINWVTAIFLLTTPVVALIWGGIHTWEYGLSWGEIGMFALFTHLTGMSITGGYHRLFAHRAYQARGPVRAAYLLFGAAAFQHSALSWSSDHRRHHKHIDKEGDPYSVKRGFMWAHIGWLLVDEHKEEDFSNVEDLSADWMVRAQHDYYAPIAVGVGFGLPLLIGYIAGNPWGYLLWGGVIRVVVVHHSTFLVNSLAHTLGRQPYTLAFSARDSLVTSLLTFGEGYHNFHHRFASDYRNGVRRFHWDPTKWLIRGLEKVGLASNLRRVPRERIIAARLQSDQQVLFARLRERSQEAVAAAQERLAEVAETVETSVARLGELEREFARVRREATDVGGEHIRQLRAELKTARREFNSAWRLWAAEIRVMLDAPDSRLA